MPGRTEVIIRVMIQQRKNIYALEIDSIMEKV